MTKVETFRSVLIGFTAIGLVAVAVRRALPARQPSAPDTHDFGAAEKPTYVDDWQKLKRVGRTIGDSNAKVTVVVFSDFECPYCRRFHEAYELVKDSLGPDIAMVFIHHPIGSHKFAIPGIVASQCAEAQGHFSGMVDELFASQDSLGFTPWTMIAHKAGVADTAAFQRCFLHGGLDSLSNAGVAEGASMNVHATPTVLINGWRYSGFHADSLLALARESLRP